MDLGDRILPAFDTPSGLPTSMINLGKREGVMNPDTPELVSTAEAATLQLEFRYLSWLTDNEEYWEKAEKVTHTPDKLKFGNDEADRAHRLCGSSKMPDWLRVSHPFT